MLPAFMTPAEEEIASKVMLPLAQTLLATIRARWGGVEQWVAEAQANPAGIPGLPEGWEWEEIVDLMRVAEKSHARAGSMVCFLV